MYTDALLKFSDAQALTATAVSTNVVDLGVDRDIGIGEAMCLAVFVGVAADYTTADETYQFILQTDNNVFFSSATTVVATPAIKGDELTLGKVVVLPIGFNNERYLRVTNVLAGTTPSITIDAFLTPLCEVSGLNKYAAGYTIS
jgi:hypothetical protein